MNTPNTPLCIGISSTHDSYDIATLETGKAMIAMKFPATAMGVEGIRHFLSSQASPLRLAVAGVAALSLALALGNAPRREVFILSSSAGHQPVALAHYAERSI